MNYIYEGSIKIPAIYYVSAGILGLAVAVYCHFYNKIKCDRKLKTFPAAIFVSYVFLILASTVLSRTPKEYYDYNLRLFWSYEAAFNGSSSLFLENLFNIIMLIPPGFLIPAVFKANFLKTILSGFIMSLTIELLQLILKRGLFEFDDMFHNTLGTLTGFCLYKIIGFIKAENAPDNPKNHS